MEDWRYGTNEAPTLSATFHGFDEESEIKFNMFWFIPNYRESWSSCL